MNKKQTTQATANNTTDAQKNSTPKEDKPISVVEFIAKVEKRDKENVAFVSLPIGSEVVLKFNKTATKIVRGDTPELDKIETETITQEVTATGEKLNAIVNEKFGLSKEQLLNQIENLPEHQKRLIGMATARVRGIMKRSLNPFAL